MNRAWDAVAGLSLLLAVAAAVMWACSYRWYDEAGVLVGRQLFAFNSACGETGWVWDTDFYGDPRRYVRRRPLGDSMYANGMAHFLERRFAGFGFRYQYSGTPGGRGTMFRVLVVPYWFVLLVTGAAPAYWLVVTRRARRRRTGGLCPGCGYDLRASTGRCPECGRPFTLGG